MSHIHDLIDFVVNVFITYENKVLLVNHKKMEMWLPVGGHIELNEDTDEALFREVKEECGLEIEVLSQKPTIQSDGTKFLYTPKFLDIHEADNQKHHRHIAFVYFAKSKTDKFIHNKEEHYDIRWFTKKDLDNVEFHIIPAVKFYATEALTMN